MPSSEQRRFLETAVSKYQAALAADTSVLAYLARRGISPQVANSFRLGVVSDPLPGHEAYRGRLSLPYLTPAGPVSFNFRCMRSHDCKAEGCKKYLKPAGTQNHLYNVGALKMDAPYLVIAEGEIDTISWAMSGVPAVGLSGVNAWEEHFPLTLGDFDVIYSAADADEAGSGLAARLTKEVGARPLKFPEGLDSNDLYAQRGPDALRALISG